MNQVIVLIDISELTSQLAPEVRRGSYANFIPVDEFEKLYDWIINEAFSNVLRLTINGHIRLMSHPDNSAYRCVYDDVGFYAETLVKGMVASSGLVFLEGQNIKTLVTYQQLIISRTFQSGV